MKKIKLLVIILITTNVSFAQVATNSYRLYLTDKNNNTYSINNPDEFLTPQAINRRLQQNIEIKINDLPISKAYLDSLNTLGLTILNKSKWLNTVVVHTTNQALIDTITNIGFIKSKQKTTSVLKTNSNKKSFEKQDLTILSQNDEPLNYGYATTQISMLNGHVLHQNDYKGQGITIAVIDAGFYNVDLLPAFESLWDSAQILGTKDFVDGDIEVFDASSHGMKVLSTMGGNISGELIGTAPKANYWLLRSEEVATEYSIEEDNWAAAAEFADSVGADIITSSLGYSEFDDSLQNYSYSDMDGNTTFITKAADLAASKGILVVNSAGNLADDPWNYISAPADGDSVLTIGAVDAFATYATFSGIGPTSDGRIKPNVAAMGYQTAVQDIDGSITVANGTSFSAPIIAGMAACLWQYYPELNNMQIIQKIEESAHQYSNPDYKLGYGIPDFGKAANLINTNIISFAEKILIRIYPNPFHSYINIELLQKSNETVSIELYSIIGEKIIKIEKPIIDQSIIEINNLEDLPSGIYLLKIKIGDRTTQKRISKIN
ncbi:MAG: S8 family serine peptidase [Bacteroidales bacterium]|jgi:serine protease AprX|nr:S8 family serine peptidase [Bacteroidales bacterium]